MGNQEQFIAAYDQYGEKLLRHIQLRVSDPDLAQDLLQDTFFKAWRYVCDDQQAISHPQALLYRIANNLIIDHYRRKPRTPLPLEDHADLAGPEDTAAEVDRQLDHDHVLSLLDCLGEEQKLILLYRYVDELPSKEISRLTGKSVVHVNVIIHRCLKQLKRKLHAPD